MRDRSLHKIFGDCIVFTEIWREINVSVPIFIIYDELTHSSNLLLGIGAIKCWCHVMILKELINGGYKNVAGRADKLSVAMAEVVVHSITCIRMVP